MFCLKEECRPLCILSPCGACLAPICLSHEQQFAYTSVLHERRIQFTMYFGAMNSILGADLQTILAHSRQVCVRKLTSYRTKYAGGAIAGLCAVRALIKYKHIRKSIPMRTSRICFGNNDFSLFPKCPGVLRRQIRSKASDVPDARTRSGTC